MMAIALPFSQLPRGMEDVGEFDTVGAVSSAPVENISIAPFWRADVL